MCFRFWVSLLTLEENKESKNMVIQISVKNGMKEVTVDKNKPVDPGIFKTAYVI